MSDTAHFLMTFLKEMLGADPKDETLNARAELAAERVEIALGGRNSRIKGSLDMKECRPWRDASRASQAGEFEGAKCTGHGSEEACSPSSARN